MLNPKKYTFVDGLKFTCLASSGSNSLWALFLFLVNGWITVESDEMEEAGDAGRTVNDAGGTDGPGDTDNSDSSLTKLISRKNLLTRF